MTVKCTKYYIFMTLLVFKRTYRSTLYFAVNFRFFSPFYAHWSSLFSGNKRRIKRYVGLFPFPHHHAVNNAFHGSDDELTSLIKENKNAILTRQTKNHNHPQNQSLAAKAFKVLRHW